MNRGRCWWMTSIQVRAHASANCIFRIVARIAVARRTAAASRLVGSDKTDARPADDGQWTNTIRKERERIASTWRRRSTLNTLETVTRNRTSRSTKSVMAKLAEKWKKDAGK